MRKTQIYKQFYALCMGMLLSVMAFCQDEKKVDLNINVNKGDPQWYMQPWVWVVGGAVFLLLLVALLKSGGKKD
jgi:hypothetical protein